MILRGRSEDLSTAELGNCRAGDYFLAPALCRVSERIRNASVRAESQGG